LFGLAYPARELPKLDSLTANLLAINTLSLVQKGDLGFAITYQARTVVNYPAAKIHLSSIPMRA